MERIVQCERLKFYMNVHKLSFSYARINGLCIVLMYHTEHEITVRILTLSKHFWHGLV